MAPRAGGLAIALVTIALAVGACGSTRVGGATYPPAGATPITATTETEAARAAVVDAVASTGLVVAATSQPYRPPEGPWFAAAPRTVVELDAPAGGAVAHVVLYGFASMADAASAAADQAAYVARPTSQVYFPSGSRFVIRVLGSAAIFLAWVPDQGDPRVADVVAALEHLGTGAAPSG